MKMIPPPGALVHVCYGKPGQLRMLDVFESPEAFQEFAKVLIPIIQAAGVAANEPELLPLYAWGTR